MRSYKIIPTGIEEDLLLFNTIVFLKQSNDLRSYSFNLRLVLNKPEFKIIGLQGF